MQKLSVFLSFDLLSVVLVSTVYQTCCYYSGEEFYRNTGGVHWSIACLTVPDGIGKIRIGDAIWPVAELITTILISILTGGYGAAFSTVMGAFSSAVMEVIKTASKLHSLLNSFSLTGQTTRS